MRRLFLMCGLLLGCALPKAELDEPSGAAFPQSAPFALSPTSASAPKTPSYKDPLPKGALQRLGSGRLWTNGYVYGLAFSGDDLTVVSVNYSGLVQRWDVSSGEELERFSPKGVDFAQSFALSPDARLLANGQTDPKTFSTHVYLWDLSTKKLERKLSVGSSIGIQQIAVGDDGAVALACSDGYVRYYATGATSPSLQLFRGNSTPVKPIDYKIPFPREEERGVSLSPDGRWLASIHDDGTLRVYTLPSGAQKFSLSAYPTTPTPAFSGDSTQLTYFGDKGFRLVELSTGKDVGVLPWSDCGYDTPLSARFSPDGTRVAVSTDNRGVCVWDVAKKDKPIVKRVHGDRVEQLAFSHNSKLLASGGRDGAIGLWKMPSVELALPTPRHFGGVSSLEISPDGKKVITSGGDGAVYVWDTSTGEALLKNTNEPRFSRPWCHHPIKITPDGKGLYSSITGGFLVQWNLETGEEVLNLGGSDAVDLALSPDGKRLATIDAWGGLALLDTKTHKIVHQLQKQRSSYSFFVVFSPDSKTIAANTYENLVSLWDVSSGKLLSTQTNQVYGLLFAPDGKKLVVQSYDQLTYYLFEAGKLKKEKAMKQDGPFAFSPDGAYLAYRAKHSTIEVREEKTGTITHSFPYQEGTKGPFLVALRFAPDGSFLVSSYSDGTSLVWPIK